MGCGRGRGSTNLGLEVQRFYFTMVGAVLGAVFLVSISRDVVNLLGFWQDTIDELGTHQSVARTVVVPSLDMPTAISPQGADSVESPAGEIFGLVADFTESEHLVEKALSEETPKVEASVGLSGMRNESTVRRLRGRL